MTAPLPTLDDLAADPAKVAGLPPSAVQTLTLRCAAVLAALAAHQPSNGAGAGTVAPPAEDRLLTPEETATRLGITPRWLYRHANRLPFTRRLSRKVLRFSEAGLGRWQATRSPLTPR